MSRNPWRTLLLAAAIGAAAFGRAGAGGEPAAFSSSAGRGANGDDQAYEALTRGPVHEAFAEAYVANPQPGPLVAEPPPPPVRESPPPADEHIEGLVWIPGYWAWDDAERRYVWVSGVWRRPPPGRTWVPGRWAPAGEGQPGWRRIPGYWASPDEAASPRPRPAPPESLETGPTGPAPSESHFWVPGCWLPAADQCDWRPGFWSRYQPPWVWVPARWVWTPAGCVWVSGYWDFALDRRGCLFAPILVPDPWRTPSGWRYVPHCELRVSVVALHLFVQPARRRYCFGDYYDPQARRLGVLSSCDYHLRRPGGYDPLYECARAAQGVPADDYAARWRRWQELLLTHAELRPPHTFAGQTPLAGSQLNRGYLQQLLLGRSAGEDDLAERLRRWRAIEAEAAARRLEAEHRWRLRQHHPSPEGPPAAGPAGPGRVAGPHLELGPRFTEPPRSTGRLQSLWLSRPETETSRDLARQLARLRALAADADAQRRLQREARQLHHSGGPPPASQRPAPHRSPQTESAPAPRAQPLRPPERRPMLERPPERGRLQQLLIPDRAAADRSFPQQVRQLRAVEAERRAGARLSFEAARLHRSGSPPPLRRARNP